MKRIKSFVLRNPAGLECEVSNYGGKILRLMVPNDKGEMKDIVLGFKTMEEWQTKETYFNAMIGRVANRIKDGKFTIDGEEYHVPINNDGNCNHGGLSGFNEKVWEIVGQSNYSISLHYRSADGEEGFPGTMDVYVTYQLTRDNSLAITMEAKCDKSTPCGFTNHAYFNLAGEDSGRVDDHILTVHTDKYTPVDESHAPTGEIASVEGTPMDFRQPTRLGDRMGDPFFAAWRGIDNGWYYDIPEGEEETLHKCATLEADGRRMEVWSNMPQMMVYTGNWIEQNEGKNGTLYDVQHAVCLECQPVANAVNCPNFPSAILRPGEVFYEKIVYKFL